MTPSEIRAVRERMGVTQVEFAQLLNVSRNTVVNWEAGKAQPSELKADLIRQYDRRAREQQSDQWVKRFLALAAGGAFGALLGQLFSSPESES
jgi:DNA-binding XRE family transcriptional regulator